MAGPGHGELASCVHERQIVQRRIVQRRIVQRRIVQRRIVKRQIVKRQIVKRLTTHRSGGGANYLSGRWVPAHPPPSLVRQA